MRLRATSSPRCAERSLTRGLTRSSIAGAGLLLVVGFLLHAPALELGELMHEEGRRVLPARAMQESGDWLLPTIWGKAYLAKPPLFFWLAALLAELRGAVVGALDVRGVSVLSTLLTALLVGAVGRRAWGNGWGLAAGLLFLTLPASLQKGSLGELEALLGLCVFAASWASWRAVDEGGWFLPAGLALGLALLCKGPPAWVLVLAPLALRSLRERRWRPLLGPPTLGMLALSALPLGLWVLALERELGSELLASTWGEELGGGGASGALHYLKVRLAFAFGLLGAFLPLPLLWWRARRGESGRPRDPLLDTALCMVGASALFFLLWPRTASRYAYPSAGWAALASVGYLRALVARGVWSPLLLRKLLLAWLLCAQVYQLARPWLRSRDDVLPALAASIDASLPPQATLHMGLWRDFNLASYFEHPARWVDGYQIADLEAGAHVLVDGTYAERLLRRPRDGWAVAQRVAREGEPLLVLLVRQPH